MGGSSRLATPGVDPSEAALTAGWLLAGATALLSAGTLSLAAEVDPLWPGATAVATLAVGAAGVSWPSARRVAWLTGLATVYGVAGGVVLATLSGTDPTVLLAGARAAATAAGAVWVALGAVAVPRHWPDARPGWWPTAAPSDATSRPVGDRPGSPVGRRVVAGDDRLPTRVVLCGGLLVALSPPVGLASPPAGTVVLGAGLAATVVGAVALGAERAREVATVAGTGAVCLLVALVGAQGLWELLALVGATGAILADPVLGPLVPALRALSVGVVVACLAVAAAMLGLGYPTYWLLADPSGLSVPAGRAGPADAAVPAGVAVVLGGLAWWSVSVGPGAGLAGLGAAAVVLALGGLLALVGGLAGSPRVALPAFRATTALALPVTAVYLSVDALSGAGPVLVGLGRAIAAAWTVALAATGVGASKTMFH